jgi:hypothetical protein
MRLRHQDDVRKKIQASRLIGFLAEHAEGKREMTPTQVQSAKILLDKSVSNAPTEVKGPGDNGEHKVTQRIEMVIVDAP